MHTDHRERDAVDGAGGDRHGIVFRTRNQSHGEGVGGVPVTATEQFLHFESHRNRQLVRVGDDLEVVVCRSDQTVVIVRGDIACEGGHLLDGVADLLAGIVLGHSPDDAVHVVQVGDGERVAHFRPARIFGCRVEGEGLVRGLVEHHLHGLTHIIDVLGIAPVLIDVEVDGVGRVGVGDDIAVSRIGDIRFIFCYSIFGDTIGYFSTSVILRQIGEAPNPVVRSVDGRVGNFSAVSQQVDGDG